MNMLFVFTVDEMLSFADWRKF